MSGAVPSPELRLEDLEWLRGLAARLVRDPHTADDAVQDALVKALERGPAARASLRAWLATILRNGLRQEWRGRARRAARESAAGVRGPEPSALEVVEELALHQRLAAEVQALDEPYRTAILLRYLRGREAADIARELGVPEKTVRSRLERGLARLRERMGRDREAWLACLALPRPPVAAAPAAPFLWLVPMNLKVVGVLVGLSLVGAYFVLRDPLEDAETPIVATAPPEVAVAPAPPAPAPLLAREPLASAAPQAAPGAAPASAPVTETPRIRGAVRTLDGSGVAGLSVVFRREDGAAAEARTTSGADGHFELALVPERGHLDVDDARYVGVARPYLEGKPPLTEPILVVAPSGHYAGVVITPTGAPIAGASVALTLPGPIVQSRDVGGSPVHLLLPFAETKADELGLFRLERVGFVEGARLVAGAEGFAPGEVALPSLARDDLELVLTPSQARTLHGLVLDARGAPAVGAQVSAGGLAVTAGADGAFALELEAWRSSGWLRALRGNELPAELALTDALFAEPTSPLVLQLGSAARAIRGRVLDADGAPVPWAEVFSPDTTPFGSVVHQISGNAVSGEIALEAHLAGQSGPGELVLHARADAEGRFELDGLLERAYALFALDPRTLDGAGPVDVAAGETRAELRLAGTRAVRVAGRVVSRSGTPLAGVTLALGRHFPWEADQDVRAARWRGFLLPSPPASRLCSTPAATTDAEGRFDLGMLALEGSYAALRGDALALGAVEALEGHADPSALEISVDAASRFRVALRRAGEADAFSLLRPNGEEVVLFLEVEGLTITALKATIDAGRSGTVLAVEGEYVLVLHAGDREVRRERLRLAAGGLHEIEL